MEIGGDMSGHDVDTMLVKNITKGGEQAGFLDGADAEMSMVAANAQDKVGGSPSLEGGGWRWRWEDTNNIVGGDGGGKMRKQGGG